MTSPGATDDTLYGEGRASPAASSRTMSLYMYMYKHLHRHSQAAEDAQTIKDCKPTTSSMPRARMFRVSYGVK